jgi:hypothetical protein
MSARLLSCALAFALAAAIVTSSAATAATTTYRAIVLVLSGNRLVLGGGGVLRVAATCTCASDVAGRAALIDLDDDGNVVALRRADTASAATAKAAKAASDIPRTAYAIIPQSSSGGDPTVPVAVTIVVTVPAQTPATDDVFLSTERSGWNPAEVRMDRLDALHWTISLTLPRGAHFAYRFSRGSFATGERDDSRQLPPAHTLTAAAGTIAHATVANWADIT